MSRTFRTLALASVLALPVGCATQQDMSNVRKQVNEMRSIVAETRVAVNEIQREVETLRGQVDQVGYDASNRGPSEEALVARLGSLESRLSSLERPTTWRNAPPPPDADAYFEAPEGSPSPAGSGCPGLVPERVPAEAPVEFREGVDHLARAEWDLAIQKFRDVLRRDPRSPIAADAQYGVGEAYYQMNDFNRSILNLNDVRLRYRKSPRLPAALLRLGDAFERLGDRLDARLVLQKLVSEHPDSCEAGVAKDKLLALESPG